MRRLLTMLAVLAVVGAVAIFTLRRTGGVGGRLPSSRAAELAPAETILFLHVPDLERARGRWKANELGVITSDPEKRSVEWCKMMSAGLKKAVGDSELAELFCMLAELDQTPPEGGFVAVTSFAQEPMQKVVAGFPFRAKRSEVDVAVRAAKERLLARWPGAKSELSSHRGIEIETITGATPLEPRSGAATSRRAKVPGKPRPPSAASGALPAVHLAFRDDWVFFSTDRELLEGTLDRYLRRSDAPASLAQNPIFAECAKHATPDADFLAWVPWEPEGREFAERLSLLAFPSEQGAENPLQAVLYSCALDAPRSRDQVYFHLARPMPATPLANHSLGLTSPRLHGYGVLNFDALHGAGDWVRAQFWNQRKNKRGFMADWKKAEFDELWTAFGPELAFTLQSGQDGKWREFVVALEVRDATKAQRFAEQVAREYGDAVTAQREDWVRWEWTSFQCQMVLTKTHLVFSSSTFAAATLLGQAGSNGPTLEHAPAYLATMQALAKRPEGAPDGMVLYVDVPAYFAQAKANVGNALDYEFEHSVIISRRTPRYPDNRQYPAERIAAELQPGTVSLRSAGSGWLLESTLGMAGNTILLMWLRDP